MPTVSPALTRPRPRTPARRADALAAIVLFTAGVALFASASVLLADPPRVDLVVDNPTSYHVNVHVRPVDGGERLGLGMVGTGSSKTFALVIDQGERWVFEFSYGGVTSSELELARSAVTAGAIAVPDSVEGEFRAAGLAPSP